MQLLLLLTCMVKEAQMGMGTTRIVSGLARSVHQKDSDNSTYQAGVSIPKTLRPQGQSLQMSGLSGYHCAQSTRARPCAAAGCKRCRLRFGLQPPFLHCRKMSVFIPGLSHHHLDPKSSPDTCTPSTNSRKGHHFTYC